MRIVVSGASGFIGAPLRAALTDKGHTVLPLARDRAASDLVRDLAGADAIVNLAGEPIGQRWTDNAKAKIRASRIDGTRRLVSALSELPSDTRPRVLVSASGVGIYGDRGDEILTESAAIGTGFLAEVARDWEAEARAAEKVGLRVVLARTGVVFGAGGALPKLVKPIRAGVGGKLGNGRQWMPWIALADAVALYIDAIENTAISGPLHVVGPTPMRNGDLVKAIGRLVQRPTFLPAPSFLLGAVLGEMKALLLESQRAVPERALAAGFQFRLGDLEAAVRAALDAGL